LREMLYSGFRMGYYEPMKQMLNVVIKNEESPVLKLGAGFLSGAVGSAIFNPLDLLKVRFQSQLPQDPLPYNGRMSVAFVTIVKERGVRGLYTGATASIMRAAFLTSAQIGSYDVIKNNILVKTFGYNKEKQTTHLSASMLASIICTTTSNPPDMLKTRMMNDKVGTSGIIKHALLIYRTEGMLAFMNGWCASYCRIGPHTIISFLLVERIRQLVGMATY